MDPSANRSSVVPSAECPKKRIYSSTNGGSDPKKKMCSTHGRSRKLESPRVEDSARVISKSSSFVGLKSIVCTPEENIGCKLSTGVVSVTSKTVEVLQPDDSRKVCNDDNPVVPVDLPNENKTTVRMVGEEFGDLLARLNRLGPSMQQRLKQCEESIVSKDEEIIKLKNELKDEKEKASKLLRVANECQQLADSCDVEKESALLREKLLSCEFDVLKAKYVEKENMIGHLQRELEKANKAGRARHQELEEDIMGLRETIARLTARNAALQEVIDELDHDRWWLITEGFSYVFDKLRKSVEFLQPYGILRSLLFKSKFQDGLRFGYDLCSKGLVVDAVPGYDPDIDRKLNLAIDDLDAHVFPYLRHLAANADMPLDVIRAIVPDSG